jgi:hypothetical protein
MPKSFSMSPLRSGQLKPASKRRMQRGAHRIAWQRRAKTMRTHTVAGLMAGSALGIAVGAGLMMMPQSKPMRKAIEKGASDLSRTVANWKR